MSKREKYEKLLNNVNVVAVLHMINQVESNYGSDSYNVIYGGSRITLGPNHPDIAVQGSTAAGRYQFLTNSWNEVNSQIGPLDFSNPRHQDIAAIARMEYRGVLEDVLKGDIRKALTGGYPDSWTHQANGVCSMPHSGLACEWAGLAPSRYGQGDATIEKNIADFEKFKGVPLPQGGTKPTDTSTNIDNSSSSSSTSSSSTSTTESQTAMQAFQASLKYGPSSIVGFLGDTNRGPLPYLLRVHKVMGGNAPTNVNKVMGGEGSMAGFVPGMNTTSTSTSNSTSNSTLQAGKFTPRPGSYINPAPGVPVNSGYGWRWGRMHTGVDQAAEPGTPILASGDGLVSFTGWDGGYGNVIKIQHSDGLTTTYNHLLDGSTKVKVGQNVKQGDVIAGMGSTGFSTGPHLHFEFWRGKGVAGDSSIDPQTIIPDLI